MNVHHALVDHAARALEGLDVVFVGGGALPLLFELPIPARETDDADCIVLVSNRAEFAALECALRARGLRQPIERDGPVCRWWTQDDRAIDVMPVAADVLGFSNRWYDGAFRNAVPTRLETGRVVKIAASPWMLATKIEAFRGRGAGFPYGSHDLEDIFTLVRARPSLAAEVVAAGDAALRAYLRDFVVNLLTWPELPDLIDGHMEPPRTDARRLDALDKLRTLASVADGTLPQE